MLWLNIPLIPNYLAMSIFDHAHTIDCIPRVNSTAGLHFIWIYHNSQRNETISISLNFAMVEITHDFPHIDFLHAQLPQMRRRRTPSRNTATQTDVAIINFQQTADRIVNFQPNFTVDRIVLRLYFIS